MKGLSSGSGDLTNSEPTFNTICFDFMVCGGDSSTTHGFSMSGKVRALSLIPFVQLIDALLKSDFPITGHLWIDMPLGRTTWKMHNVLKAFSILRKAISREKRMLIVASRKTRKRARRYDLSYCGSEAWAHWSRHHGMIRTLHCTCRYGLRSEYGPMHMRFHFYTLNLNIEDRTCSWHNSGEEEKSSYGTHHHTDFVRKWVTMWLESGNVWI